MVRKSELRIKHGTEVAHTGREGYVRKERGEPLTIDLRELPVATEPDGLSLRGIASIPLLVKTQPMESYNLQVGLHVYKAIFSNVTRVGVSYNQGCRAPFLKNLGF